VVHPEVLPRRKPHLPKLICFPSSKTLMCVCSEAYRHVEDQDQLIKIIWFALDYVDRAYTQHKEIIRVK
jgi:hypothetical protein